MPTPRNKPQTTPTVRLVVALCAVLASAGCIAASLLSWISLTDQDGTTSISGWGTVSGGQINGTNINDLPEVSFRPGVLAVVIAALALIAAFGMILLARGPKPHRIPASLLALCGLGGGAWGLYRGLHPGDLNGTYSQQAQAENGVAVQISSGAGAWLTAGCSLILLAAAVVVFTGLLDPPKPLRPRGIQPR